MSPYLVVFFCLLAFFTACSITAMPTLGENKIQEFMAELQYCNHDTDCPGPDGFCKENALTHGRSNHYRGYCW
ncbi:hypothetical protein L596_026793 [Steinernema carpocapsae]|uniref:Uncharacterized protein n=1 Tax=Steinernema carpocapsae TaxID=34508 RepID=A0A4U5M2E2_STECR|nr:hypothetical protein L596_026792 [Steinernema carpocapsae]TKR62891.1 hypothetical protein L596_026793 [Steinernema carpocapsae]